MYYLHSLDAYIHIELLKIMIIELSVEQPEQQIPIATIVNV